MLYGTAKFVLRADADKQEVEVPWAGRVVFGEGEELKMRFYQVYLVSVLFLPFSFFLALVRMLVLTGVGSYSAIWKEVR